MSAAVARAVKLSPAEAREMAQNMLLGQHSVGFTADCTGLPRERVEALAKALHAARRIPQVRP